LHAEGLRYIPPFDNWRGEWDELLDMKMPEMDGMSFGGGSWRTQPYGMCRSSV
jgi:hypothetical protein